LNLPKVEEVVAWPALLEVVQVESKKSMPGRPQARICN
jgi:hypothetical protein